MAPNGELRNTIRHYQPPISGKLPKIGLKKKMVFIDRMLIDSRRPRAAIGLKIGKIGLDLREIVPMGRQWTLRAALTR